MGNSGTPAKNKKQTPGKGYSIARVNQASVDATPDGADIVLGMFYINSIHATILFDSGATHSFMSARYANTNEIPLLNMRKPMIVITPKGPIDINNYGKRIWNYCYNIRGQHYRSDPWYVMVKEGKGHYSMW
jgi:hypothetical protein